MTYYRKSSKISSQKKKQEEFLEKLHQKGFKSAKIIDSQQNQNVIKRKEDKELLIVK